MGGLCDFYDKCHIGSLHTRPGRGYKYIVWRCKPPGEREDGFYCGACRQCCPGRIGFHEGRVCKCTIYIHLPLHVGWGCHGWGDAGWGCRACRASRHKSVCTYVRNKAEGGLRPSRQCGHPCPFVENQKRSRRGDGEHRDDWEPQPQCKPDKHGARDNGRCVAVDFVCVDQ